MMVWIVVTVVPVCSSAQGPHSEDRKGVFTKLLYSCSRFYHTNL